MNVAARRPAPAPVATAAPLSGEVLSLADLASRGPAWDRLLAGAAHANPFYGRAVAEAHAAHGVSAVPRFCTVSRGSELAAVLPVVRGRVGLWRTAALGWGTPFTTNGTPLLPAQDGEGACAALLDLLAAESRLVMLRLASLDSPAVALLRAALSRRQWPSCEIAPFARPLLRRRASFEAYAGEHLSGSRRKGLRRRRSKLAELGTLAFETATSGPALAQAVEDFLALERAGWKGARGTALASRPETARLARALFGDGAGPVAPRADVLRLDGHAIAASLALVCGGTAHLLKTAYDESLRSLAPGIVLEAEIVRAFHEDRFADCLDSASLPGGVLDGLYPDRDRVGDLLFATSPQVSEAALLRVAGAELAARRGTKAVKELYWKVRERG